MKRKNAVIAFGLVLGFSATSVFAYPKPLNYNSPTNQLSDRFAQVQRQAIEAKSLFLDEVEKPAASVGVIKRIRTLPKLKRKKTPAKRKAKPPVAGRKKTFKEKNDAVKKNGKSKTLKNTETYRAKTVKKVKNKDREAALKLSKRELRIYGLIKNARNLERLTPAQKSQILALHLRVLKTKDAQNLLKTIQIGEGGGPLVIVGKGYGKSKRFKTIMKRLDFSTHPAKQFPKGMRCFVFNRQVGKCSTASGSYQITESNYNFYARQFGLKDFSIENQQIIALELIRTGRAKTERGNYKGRGYVELLKGNMQNAIRYGTNDWASSPHSEWGGAKAPYLQIVKTVEKKEKKKDQAYFQNWLDEFERENAS